MEDTSLVDASNGGMRFTVGDKEYEFTSLRLRHEMELEDRLGEKIRDLDFSSAKVRAHIAWIMMRETDSDLTIEQVADLFDAENREQLEQIVVLGMMGYEAAKETLLDPPDSETETEPTTEVKIEPTEVEMPLQPTSQIGDTSSP